MQAYTTKPLIEYLRMVPDPRCGRRTKHDYAEVLLCIVLGYLAGRITIRRALRWCVVHLEELRKYSEFKNGIASVPTACRILMGIDVELFTYAFMEWIGEIVDTKGKHLAIDGKALRGALEKTKVYERGRPMLMNVLETATGVVIGQLPMENKDSEIKAIPEMLKLLDLEGSTITIDAIGTQTAIMDQIAERGGHFVLVVKRNQLEAYRDIRDSFGKLEKDYNACKKAKKEGRPYSLRYPELLKTYDTMESQEKNRDRYETRICSVCHAPELISRTKDDWIHIKTVGICRQVRIPVEKDINGEDITPDCKTFMKKGSRRVPVPEGGDGIRSHVQDVGLISDLELTAKWIMEIKRNHWAVENKLHHVLDDTFREDRSPSKRSKNSLSLIRKIAYNIHRIAMLAGRCSGIFTEAMDDFSDDPTLMRDFVFTGIKSLY